MDRANTRQPSLLSPHTERRGQTAEIGDFHNAFLYSCACSVSSMHTTGFPFGDRIRCTCQNKYRCTLTVLSATRHGRRRARPVQEAPAWPLNVFALVEHVSVPANHEQLKWTKDDCGSLRTWFLSKIPGTIYFDTIIQAFLFFLSSESVKSNSSLSL